MGNVSSCFENSKSVFKGSRSAPIGTPFQSEVFVQVYRVIKRYGGSRFNADPQLLPDGSKLMDSPQFPAEYAESARSTAQVLATLKEDASDLDWTFLCPAAFFDERGRTGIFRLGLDDLLVADDGHSSISIEDYAVAMIDELERPRHGQRRFTVGY